LQHGSHVIRSALEPSAAGRYFSPTGRIGNIVIATPDDLSTFLSDLGIAARTVSHPPLFTVEQSQALRGEIAGAHTKNLFLKDKKGALFLVVAREEAGIDLKRLHERIGASSRLSFGKPELLLDTLGVTPGAVTVFGLINDRDARINVIVDSGLLESEKINCHPLVNTATTTIAAGDLLAFVAATGHTAKVIDLDGQRQPPDCKRMTETPSAPAD
jgi:Ala-tRNA(Pro) deacylase